MDDDGQSGLDSPTLQSNPGTPLPAHQVSNPGTPRSEDLICPPNAMAGTLPTSATSLISVATHLSSMAGGSNSNSNSSNNNNSGGPLLLQVATAGVGHSVGPGCVPQGSSITQSMTTCVNRQPPQSKYAQLLAVIEDLGKDIRPTYAGSKSSAERLKRGIVHARILISRLNCWTKFDTKLSADSVEWCPIPSRREILVCGTYELTKGQVEQRVGNLHLLRCVNNHNLEVIQKIDLPAVLDSKWCLHELNNQVVLGTTDAEGRLQLYGLKEEHIIDINSQTVGEGCIALSLDWSNVKYHSQQPLIAVSDSKGRLSIYHLNQQELRQIYQWTAHEHEAWVVAFDYWMPDVVYSGGDDCKLKVWDLRQSAKTPTFTSRQHLMGVTSIQSNQWNCNTIASGSYDERIYLWDIRKMYRPNSVVETGGGVWRLKWHPQTGKHLLAACMDAGAVIVDCHPFQTSKLWTTYREHESMVYGVDWQIPSSSLSDQETVASCSFYDHSLHLWTCSLKNRTIQRIDTRT